MRMRGTWVRRAAVLGALTLFHSCRSNRASETQVSGDPGSTGQPAVAGEAERFTLASNPAASIQRSKPTECKDLKKTGTAVDTIPPAGVVRLKAQGRRHELWVWPRQDAVIITVSELPGAVSGVEVVTQPTIPADEVWGVLFVDTKDCKFDPAQDYISRDDAALPTVFDATSDLALTLLMGNSTYVLATPGAMLQTDLPRDTAASEVRDD